MNKYKTLQVELLNFSLLYKSHEVLFNRLEINFDIFYKYVEIAIWLCSSKQLRIQNVISNYHFVYPCIKFLFASGYTKRLKSD